MLKYGIILTGAGVKRWHLRCIERLHQSKLAQLQCVVNDVSAAHVARGSDRLYSAAASQETADLEDVAALVPAAVHYEIPLAKPDGWQLTGRWFDVDFFLLLGDERSGAALANVAPYGVWYFAHGDLTRFSTSAPGFWEVHGDLDVTGAFLLQLRCDGSAGIPLKRGYLPTQRHSFERNVDAMFGALANWPLHVCWDITHGAAGYFESPALPKPALRYGDPSGLQIAAMRLRERRHRAAAYLRSNFYSIDWTVARVRETPAQFIGGDRHAEVSYLYPARKDRYLADPCVVMRDSRAYLFCEEYRTGTNFGAVSVLELGDTKAPALQPAIEEAHHLSYPHVFEHDGETYCVPESGKIRKVCLYRCVEFPDKWEYAHTLIDGFEAADSTIVRCGDRWWLFCTSSEETPKGYYSHLYVWHAPDLFGTWTPHVRNPVKIDARSARPAGPFFTHEGALYRPAQDCARSYGAAVRINRVDALTETEFKETVVGTIRPPRTGYTRGLHTLSAAGEWCVVDVERYTFNPGVMRYTCTQAIKRALLRLGMPEDDIASMKRKVRGVEVTEMRTAQPSKIE